MNKFWMKKLSIALIAALLMFGLAAFKTQNDGDRNFQRLVLAKGKNIEYTVDIARMGLLKYWLQPEYLTVSLRCQIEADADQLQYELTGIDAVVSQSGKKGNWKKLEPKDILVKRDKNTVPLNLEIVVPKGASGRQTVQPGSLRILASGELYSTIELRIINSQAKVE
ncbi:hypothetical protein [Phascolarctobacterium sp.]|uniref:hypothetical protein n=1 Tax=Phascolarctobacterium sp. TaxID=2049039 RepID=UPI0025DE649C|nr:hypothetical protein [uncultured Phascolarctobacterium sp.]